jgi:hypothetical protein
VLKGNELSIFGDAVGWRKLSRLSGLAKRLGQIYGLTPPMVRVKRRQKKISWKRLEGAGRAWTGGGEGREA